MVCHVSCIRSVFFLFRLRLRSSGVLSRNSHDLYSAVLICHSEVPNSLERIARQMMWVDTMIDNRVPRVGAVALYTYNTVLWVAN
jgi:hypothetical protein